MNPLRCCFLHTCIIVHTHYNAHYSTPVLYFALALGLAYNIVVAVTFWQIIQNGYVNIVEHNLPLLILEFCVSLATIVLIAYALLKELNKK